MSATNAVTSGTRWVPNARRRVQAAADRTLGGYAMDRLQTRIEPCQQSRDGCRTGSNCYSEGVRDVLKLLMNGVEPRLAERLAKAVGRQRENGNPTRLCNS